MALKVTESNSLVSVDSDQYLRVDTYKYFVDKAATIARDQNYTPVQWVEVFEHFGDRLDKNTVVHVWKEKTTLDLVLQAGYQAFLSNQGDWYLE